MMELSLAKTDVLSLLGRQLSSFIGDNVNIGSGTIIKNRDIPSNSTVLGISPNLCINNTYTKYS